MGGKTVVLTGVGRDRIGIVAELAQVLYERGCNLLDSSMTLLRGEFALILMVELAAGESVDKLSQELGSLRNKLGMLIHVRELTDEELRESQAEVNSYIVSVYGADRPGIVAGITRKLAETGLNITDVQTKSVDGRDHGGGSVFVMILEITAPLKVNAQEVESALKQIGGQLGVDVSVQALDVVEL